MDPGKERKRIPTLDGWRGIAILLVLAFHIQGGLFSHVYRGYNWLAFGRHGVAVFLVLSGYLITTRLLREDKIDLRRFYVRRFFKLMPTAWLYLATVWALCLLSGIHVIGRDTMPSLLFVRNYFPGVEADSNEMTGHFWSLSLEEQFYLTWPVILYFIGRKRALVFAIVAAAGCAVFRLHHWQAYNHSNAVSVRSEVNIDGLLVGCILAILLYEWPQLKQFLILHNWRLLLGCAATVPYFLMNFPRLIPLTEFLVIAIAIGCTSVSPHTLFARFLENKHLSQIGMMSYTIYVWQQLFVVPHWVRIGALLLPIVAIASWTYIEQPGVRLGRKLSANRQPASAPVG